jgi:hypothetical protein
VGHRVTEGRRSDPPRGYGGKARGSPPEGFAERLSWSQIVPVTARRDIDVLRTRPGGVGGAGDEPTGCQA